MSDYFDHGGDRHRPKSSDPIALRWFEVNDPDDFPDGFDAPWANAGDPYATLAFRKGASGLEKKGHVKDTTGAGYGTTTRVCTLPSKMLNQIDKVPSWLDDIVDPDTGDFTIARWTIDYSTGEVFITYPALAGIPGAAGADGTNGATIFFTHGAPSGGNDGDIAIDQDTWDVYQKVLGSWSLIGNISSSTNQWYVGSGAPSGGLGSNGDLYLDESNGDIYHKVSGSWGSPIGNLQGPTGAAGADGMDGADGVDGATIHVGSGAPSGGLGNNGDLYFDEATADLYSKSGGSWSVIANLRGPSGRLWELKVIADTTVLATGDGQAIMCVPSELNGLNLTGANAFVTTVSSSGLPTVQLRRTRSGADVDMLTTKITIDASETTSYTAATPPVINTSNDDVATGDLISVDVDVAGTGAKGLGVVLSFG